MHKLSEGWSGESSKPMPRYHLSTEGVGTL